METSQHETRSSVDTEYTSHMRLASRPATWTKFSEFLRGRFTPSFSMCPFTFETLQGFQTADNLLILNDPQSGRHRIQAAGMWDRLPFEGHEPPHLETFCRCESPLDESFSTLDLLCGALCSVVLVTPPNHLYASMANILIRTPRPWIERIFGKYDEWWLYGFSQPNFGVLSALSKTCTGGD